MSRQVAVRINALALSAALLMLTSCSPDNSGIQRLPFEPEAAPAKITITPGGTNLGFIGAKDSLVAQVLDSDGNAAPGISFTWSSSNSGVASVSHTGVVTAVTEGQATVYARVLNLRDSVTVSVKRTPAELTLSISDVLFTELGVTASVAAEVLDGGGQALSADEVSWSSADTTVATVSDAGLITAVDQGNTTIKATAGAIQASVDVRVATGPSGITVTPQTIAIDAIGDTVRLSAAVVDAAGDTLPEVSVSYLWGDQSIADVDTITGLVTATGTGTTNVSVFGDTVRVTVPVTVTQTPAAVAVTPTNPTLVPGGTVTYSAAVEDRNGNTIPNPVLSWASSDVAVATITSGGVATAVAAGAASIIATSGEVADTVMLTVVDVDVDSVAVETDSLDLEVGDEAQLSATFYDSEGTELIGPSAEWTSSDDDIARVSSDGEVTAFGAGEAWIFATADNGVDSVHVAVTAVSLFNIEVRYVGTEPSEAVQAAFGEAEMRWEEIIVGDLAATAANAAAGACGIDHPAINETIDDVVIFAEITAIDGSGGILGQAGPCLVRVANGLAAVGTMQFDEDDLDDLLASGLLDETVVHEMGHVLGYGVGDPWTDVLVDAGEADPYWPGTEAVIQYGLNGGSATNQVPVANTGGSGTRDAHWRESDMGRELMTGYLNSGSNPLSSITIGAMEDMGYEVDMTKADSYTVSATFRMAPGVFFKLRELPTPPPIVIDSSGRPVGR